MKKTLVLMLASFMAFSVASFASVSEKTEVAAVADKKPKKAKKAKGEIKEVTFHAHLHCADCVTKVEENISFEKGVKDLKVSLENQTIFIKFDSSKTSEEALKAVITKLGVPVSDNCGHDHHHHHHH